MEISCNQKHKFLAGFEWSFVERQWYICRFFCCDLSINIIVTSSNIAMFVYIVKSQRFSGQIVWCVLARDEPALICPPNILLNPSGTHKDMLWIHMWK